MPLVLVGGVCTPLPPPTQVPGIVQVASIAAGCSGGSGTDVAAAAAALALRSLASATAQQHATIGSCDSGSAFSMGSDSYGGRSCGAGGDFDGSGEA